jgi:hypothetical protein
MQSQPPFFMKWAGKYGSFLLFLACVSLSNAQPSDKNWYQKGTKAFPEVLYKGY